jgi:CheY-like chemotaxis protein
MTPTAHIPDKDVSPAAVTKTAAETALPPPPGLRVMCVDDNIDAADSLGLLLSMVACEVSVAHDAMSALASVAEFRPKVCVLDITMPEMDGCELARRLRAGAGGEGMLLIALTGLGDYDSLERIAAAGFDLYFTTPVDARDLFEAFNRFALHGRPANR